MLFRRRQDVGCKRDAGVWGAMGGCGEQFEVKRGWGGAVLEWFHFILRGDWASLWPKGGALSRNPT